MTQENQIATQSATANLPAMPSNANLLQAIADAAKDPNVNIEKMHGLIDIQERLMNKQAEINFNNALAAMQDRIPRIKQNAQIEHKGVLIGKYATYEAIDDVMRPLLIEFGFGLRFNSKQSGNLITVMGTLSHKDGHSITNEIPLNLEGGGAKNSVQAAGSTITYGKRYIVQMFFNLVFEGEDDDGKKAGFVQISDEHAAEIKQLLKDTGADTAKFLKLVAGGAKSVDEMDERYYEKAKVAINDAHQRRLAAAAKKEGGAA